MAKPPLFSTRHSLCIICEGYEEEVYVRHLLAKDFWSNLYDFTIINAKGEGNIPARYQYIINKDAYELVLIFCDTDRSPYTQYLGVKAKINEMHEAEDAAGKSGHLRESLFDANHPSAFCSRISQDARQENQCQVDRKAYWDQRLQGKPGRAYQGDLRQDQPPVVF